MASTFTTQVFGEMAGDGKGIARRAKKLYNKWTNQEVTVGATYPTELDTIPTKGIEAINIGARFIEDSILGIEDPAFDFCLVQLDFAATDGLLADPAMADNENYADSAAAFFKRIGDEDRFKMLEKLIALLKEIFNGVDTDAPYRRGYVVKAINGLNGLVENRRKPGVQTELSIDCIDTVKWQIRAINGYLDKILWDDIRQVETLPINLRRFRVLMTIKDVRDLTGVTVTPTTYTWEENKKTPDIIKENNSKRVFAKYDGDTPMPFKGALHDTPEIKAYQSLILTCSCCEFKPKFLPESISNIEPVEMTQVLTFTTPIFKYDMLLPAIDAVVTAPGLLENNQKRDKWATVKSAAIGVLASYVNSMYSQGKNMLMNAAYQFAESSGALKYTNMALKYLKGDFAAQELAGLLSKRLAEQAVKDAYYTDTRKLDGSTTNRSQYSKDLGNE